MAISDKTRSGALAQVLASERKTLNEQLRVAMPGIIQSFAPDAITTATKAQRIIRCWWMFLLYSLAAEAAR